MGIFRTVPWVAVIAALLLQQISAELTFEDYQEDCANCPECECMTEDEFSELMHKRLAEEMPAALPRNDLAFDDIVELLHHVDEEKRSTGLNHDDNLLRLGKRADDEEDFDHALATKRLSDSMRLGKRASADTMRLGKRLSADSMRLGKRLSADTMRLGKRAGIRDRMEKKLVDSMRLGKRGMDTMRLGKRGMDTMRLGKRGMDTMRLGKRGMDTMRLGKRGMDTMRLGRRAVDTMRLGKRSLMSRLSLRDAIRLG